MIPDGEGNVGSLDWEDCASCLHEVEDGECSHEDFYINMDRGVVLCRGYREEAL